MVVPASIRICALGLPVAETPCGRIGRGRDVEQPAGRRNHGIVHEHLLPGERDRGLQLGLRGNGRGRVSELRQHFGDAARPELERTAARRCKGRA